MFHSANNEIYRSIHKIRLRNCLIEITQFKISRKRNFITRPSNTNIYRFLEAFDMDHFNYSHRSLYFFPKSRTCMQFILFAYGMYTNGYSNLVYSDILRLCEWIYHDYNYNSYRGEYIDIMNELINNHHH